MASAILPESIPHYVSSSSTVEAPAPEAEIHLVDLAIILVRDRKRILLLAAAFALLAALACVVLAPRYTAQTIVMPPAQGASASAMLGQAMGSAALASMAGASLGIKNPDELYVALLGSRSARDVMIERFHLIDHYHAANLAMAEAALAAHTTIALGSKDNLITISVRDRDPKFAAALANGYMDAFHQLSAHLAVTEAAQRRTFFEQQLLEANGHLSTAEEALKNTEQSSGIIQIDSQARALIENAAQLRAQITSREVELQSIRSYATDDNPQVVTLRQQIAALNGQLAQLSSSNDSGLIPSKNKVSEDGLVYANRLRDVKYYEAIADLLSRQLEAAKVDEARQGSSLQTIDPAVPPTVATFPKPLIMIPAAAVIGLLIGIFISLAAAGWRHLESNPQEAERLAELRAAFR